MKLKGCDYITIAELRKLIKISKSPTKWGRPALKIFAIEKDLTERQAINLMSAAMKLETVI